MQPRNASSFGCFGVLCSSLFLLISWLFLYSMFTAPGRSYSLLDLWVAIVTFGLPVVYLLALAIGRIRLRAPIPDPDPDNSFAGLVLGLRESWSERLYAIILLVFILAFSSAIGWAIFNRLIGTITPQQRWWWAVGATAGCLVSIFVGYRLGATPMEDRRRFSVAVMIIFFGIFSIPYGLYLGTHYYWLPMSFWGGAPVGAIGMLLIWRYAAAGWNPETLSSNPTRIDRYGNRGALMLVGLLVTLFILMDVVFGSREWIWSALIPWILFILGYTIIQAWRHRPRARTDF